MLMKRGDMQDEQRRVELTACQKNAACGSRSHLCSVSPGALMCNTAINNAGSCLPGFIHCDAFRVQRLTLNQLHIGLDLFDADP